MLDNVSAYTVSDLLTAYATEYLPTKAPTTHYQQKHLFNFLRRELGDERLTDLTPTRLRQWRDSLVERGYAAGTVRRYMDSLSGPLTVAARDYEWLKDNPMRRVKKPAQEPGRVRFLSTDERQRLFAACKRSRNPHLYTLVRLALCTGARKSELLTLRWRDIDLERGILRLARTKNKDRRAVPVAGEALRLLRAKGEGQKPEAYIFAQWSGEKPFWVRPAWLAAVKRARLEDFRFHDLRHTAASYLAMSGASLIEIAEVLGHRSMQMVRKYSHFSTGHVQSVVERMAQQFLEETETGNLELGVCCVSVWGLFGFLVA